MLRPENTHPNDQSYSPQESDSLETVVPGAAADPFESPSTQADAGLDEAPRDLSTDYDADDDFEPLREITMTDLAAGGSAPSLRSPEMDDLNFPGEIDMEELDEDALSDTDIPRDALLDPLEP